MSQRNKDLPAMPVHPMQDKFGQVILMAGMSKLEITALNILSAQLRKNKIEDLHRYELNHSDMDDDRKDAFEKVLDLAEKIKSILILGASKQIKNQDSENFLSNLSRKVEREASEIARLWFKFYGKERFKKKK